MKFLNFIQEVFPDGLVAGDGRLQPGDQLIEINGVDMTCATHAQVTFLFIYQVAQLLNNSTVFFLVFQVFFDK